jgi:hypothetical protein
MIQTGIRNVLGSPDRAALKVLGAAFHCGTHVEYGIDTAHGAIDKLGIP